MAGLVLGDFIRSNPHLVANKRVLELGAGNGLLGVILSRLSPPPPPPLSVSPYLFIHLSFLSLSIDLSLSPPPSLSAAALLPL
jgi:hypothetical protein